MSDTPTNLPAPPAPEPAPFVLDLDLDSFTLGEIDLFEEHADLAFEEIRSKLNPTDEDGNPTGTPRRVGRLLRALALVQMKRTNPSATWEDTYSIALPTRAQIEEGTPPPAVVSGTDPLG